MGHKINPEIFRLGVSLDWKYQLRDPLLANVIVYKMSKICSGNIQHLMCVIP